MYVLDTDTYSLALRGHAKISARVLQTPPADVFLCAITAEELLRGRLAVIQKAVSGRSNAVPSAYDFFLALLAELSRCQILPYDARAEALFQSWPAAWKRAGSQDCRIAAVAAVYGFTIVTCSVAHFARIGAAKIEDWSV